MLNLQDPLTSKLPYLETSIFSVMTKLANENNAINLSQGFPDFKVSDILCELVTEKLNAGYNQYAAMQGVLGLREALSENEKTHYSPAFWRKVW